MHLQLAQAAGRRVFRVDGALLVQPHLACGMRRI